MKTKTFLISSILLLVASCESAKIDFSILDKSVAVNANISPSKLRMASDNWEPNDAIGIYMISSKQIISTTSVLSANKKYQTITGNGVFTPSSDTEDMKYPRDESNVDFVAYYPFTNVNDKFEFNLSVANQENPSEIDFLYSDNEKNKNKNSEALMLNFSHMLSKVIFKIKTDDNTPLSKIEAKLTGLNISAVFSLANKSFSKENKGDIKLKISSDGTIAEAIVFPTPDLTNVSLSIVNGIDGYTFDLGSSLKIKNFASGYKNTYIVTLNKSNPEATSIEVSSTPIEPWIEGLTEDVSVDKSFDAYITTGKGTEAEPYTINDVINLKSATNVWIVGYIVGGYAEGNAFSTDFEDPKFKDTLIVLSDTLDTNDENKMIPVSISGTIKDSINLVENQNVFKKKIKIKGDIKKYYSKIGINPSKDYKFIE